MARKYDIYTSSQPPPDPTSTKLWQDTSTTPPTFKRYDGANWVSVGTQGDTGATGATGATGPTGPTGPRGLTWRGAWVSTTAYATDDGVSHDGSGWIALRANTGVTPVEGADWTILAQRGASGTAATTAALGTVRVSTAPAAGTDPTAVETGDARVPTQGENDALQGTNGTPSNTNRYATSSDPRFATYYKFFRAGSTTSPITGVGWEPVFEARTLNEVRVRFNVAPTDATTVVVQRSVGGAAPADVASVSVAANALQTVLSGLAVALAAGDALRVSITAGGTGGSDATVVCRAA